MGLSEWPLVAYLLERPLLLIAISSLGFTTQSLFVKFITTAGDDGSHFSAMEVVLFRGFCQSCGVVLWSVRVSTPPSHHHPIHPTLPPSHHPTTPPPQPPLRRLGRAPGLAVLAWKDAAGVVLSLSARRFRLRRHRVRVLLGGAHHAGKQVKYRAECFHFPRPTRPPTSGPASPPT